MHAPRRDQTKKMWMASKDEPGEQPKEGCAIGGRVGKPETLTSQEDYCHVGISSFSLNMFETYTQYFNIVIL